MKFYHAASLIFAGVLLLGGCSGAERAANHYAYEEFTVEEAPEWSALFVGSSGWSGADGIYSFPVSGDGRSVTDATARTLWVFSDTFVGAVDEAGNRAETTMVNNTAGQLVGNLPLPGEMQFFVAQGTEEEKPVALVVPETKSAHADHWYWFGDGLVMDGALQVFGYRMKPGDGGVFNFKMDGVALITLDVEEPTKVLKQVEIPLFLAANEERGEVIFGAAVLVNTKEAGAQHADGFVYVYGTQNEPMNKHLVVARVRPGEFGNFDAWEFYNGTAWSDAIEDVAALTGRVSSEYSVSPLDDGRYICVFQQDTIGHFVAVKFGASPVGPWGENMPIYECPEPKSNKDIFVYNAKAHPHLSKPGELLISYNVNSFDFWSHFKDADIYRPRFIRLQWGEH